MKVSGQKLRMLEIPRHYFLLVALFLFSVILRIPRIEYAQGRDMFVLAIEAFSFLEGTADAWLIHPLSYLGMYSFSGYPIGSIVLMSFFLQIAGMSIETATFLFTLLFVALSIPTSYHLMQRLFEGTRERALGMALFQFLPTIYDFTYNTATARAPLLALLPLVFGYLLDWNRMGKPVSVLKALAITVVMMLFHRSAIVITIIIAIAVIYPFVVRFVESLVEGRDWNMIHINRFIIVGLFGAGILLFLVSIPLEGILPKNSIPDSLLPEWIQPPLNDVLSLGVDYVLFYGPALILAFAGLWRIFAQAWRSDDLIFRSASDWIFLSALALPLIYFLGYSAYTRHLFAISVILLAVVGSESMEQEGIRPVLLPIIATVPFIVFFQLYSALWRNIEPYATQSTVLFLGLLSGILLLPVLWKKRPVLQEKELSIGDFRVILILGLLLVFTITNNGMRSSIVYNQTYPYNNTSTDEVLVAKFIMEQQAMFGDQSIILSSNFLIELRIAAYAHSNSLLGGHGTAILLVNYVDQEDALTNSTGDFLANFMRTHIYAHPVDSVRLWYEILTSNFTDSDTQQLLENLHIRFFIAIKGAISVAGPRDDTFYSEFITTLSAPIVFETEHLVVYQLNEYQF